MNRAGQLPGTRQLSHKPTTFLELRLNHNHDLGILPDFFQRRRRVPRVIISGTLHICDLTSVKKFHKKDFFYMWQTIQESRNKERKVYFCKLMYKFIMFSGTV